MSAVAMSFPPQDDSWNGNSPDVAGTPARNGTKEADRPHLTALPRDGGQPSAGDLVRAAARGEGLAWHDMVRRFSGLIGGITWSYGLNEADVADVQQVVWMRLLDHLDRLRDPDRVGAWIATTTRHECLRILRRLNRTTPTGDETTFDSASDAGDPVRTVGTDERDDTLMGLVETLPSQHQELLRMLMLDPQPSYKEISLALGIPVGSIGPTRQRCLASLRRKCIVAGIQAG